MVGRSVLAEVSALEIADIGLSSHVLLDRAKSIPLGKRYQLLLDLKMPLSTHVTLAPLHTQSMTRESGVVTVNNNNSNNNNRESNEFATSLVQERERSVFGVRALLALLQERLTKASEFLVACSIATWSIHPPTHPPRQQQRETATYCTGCVVNDHAHAVAIQREGERRDFQSTKEPY